MVIDTLALHGASLCYAFARSINWKFGKPRLVGVGPSALYLFPLSRPEWDTLGTAAVYVDTKQWAANVPPWHCKFELLYPRMAELIHDGVRVLIASTLKESQVTLIRNRKIAWAEASTLPEAFMRAHVRYHIGDRVQIPKELV